MEILVPILLPIFICAVLPAVIVWIIFNSVNNKENKRAEIMIEAIRNNNGLDADRLADALADPRKTPSQIALSRLLKGCLFSLLGITFTVATIVMRVGDYGISDMFGFPLLAAGVCYAIGISFLVVYFVSRRKSEQNEE